jgi:hypothetical protein
VRSDAVTVTSEEMAMISFKIPIQHLPDCTQENQKNVVRMLFIVDYV